MSTATLPGHSAGSDDREAFGEISSFLGVSLEQAGSMDPAIVSVIQTKIQDFHELKSQNMKLNVTIDELKSISTRRIDALKAEVEKLMKDNDLIRAGRNDLDSQISQLKSEKTNLIGDLNVSKNESREYSEQVDLLKKDKQGIVKLLEEKINELQNSKSECDRFMSDNKELRNKILELENQTQILQSSELSSKAEIQTLQQKLDLLTRNNQWLEGELNSQNEELISLRQTSGSKLQATLKELSIAKHDLHLEKTNKEVILRKNGELSKTLQEKLLEVKNMSDTLTAEKSEFQREMNLKQRLIDLLEKQASSLKEELKFVSDKNISSSTDINENQSLHSEREKLVADLTELRQKFESSEHERLRLEAVVDEFMPDEENNKQDETSTVISSTVGSEMSTRKLYGDIGILKRQLIKEKHQKENLQRQVESFIIELEHKIPVINSFKKRTSMLEKELNDVALLLEHTSKEKENKEREFDSLESKIKQYESNISSLVRQRSDLAHQVQYLLLHVSVQNDTNGPLTHDEIAFIKRILNNEDPSNMSDSQHVISERLLEFNSIVTIQEKNAELIKTVRSLADKLEAEEFAKNSNNLNIENETIKEAKEAIVTLQAFNIKLESKLTKAEKERDAYKALIPENKDKNVDPSTIESRNRIRNDESTERIKQLEANLTGVTTEYSKNIQMLNEEIQQLYKVKSEIMITLERERSSKQLAEERLKLSQNTVELMKSENSELQKRSRHLEDIMESQDQRTSKTIDEYIVCKTRLASLESKVSNLEQERDLLKNSEKRIKEDSKNISDEKNNLRIMVSQLQTLQSEREIMLKNIQDNNNERIATLEDSISKVREELIAKNSEIKELEETSRNRSQVWQEKIDSLRNECNEVREKSVEKTVSVSQLESDIKILKRELEEKNARIASFNVLNDTNSSENSEDNILKELEKTKISLSEAYSQAEEYKELSAAADETSDNLKVEFNKVREELSTKLENMEKEKMCTEIKAQDLREQLKNLKEQLQAQEEHFETEKTELRKKLSTLEANGQPLEEIKKEHEIQMAQLQKDLDEQASYANSSQKNYEEELRKHADVTRMLSELREQIHDYKLTADNLKTSKEQTSVALEGKEKSWLEQKHNYETQLDTIKQRLEDLSAQNKLLYDQIELFSKDSERREGVKFPQEQELLITLRRERDILDTKLAVSDREVKNLRQKQLSLETELERMRDQVLIFKEEASTRQNFTEEHQKIMEQLNQLNLLRESNTTLRNEVQDANKKNAKLYEEMDSLQKQFLPLQLEIDNLRNTMQDKDQQISLCKGEADRWRERSQEILRKQERIDPEEYEKLGSEVSSLKAQLEERIGENTDLNDRFNRLKKQAHEKLNASKIAHSSLTSELNELNDAKKRLEASLQEETNKCHDLESRLNQADTDSKNVENLRTDLTIALSRSKEVEDTLQTAVSSSDTLTEHLKEEIATLKDELSTLKKKEEEQQSSQPALNEDISNVVESMKQAFEQEKIDFIKMKTMEFNKELEEQKNQISISQNPIQNNLPYDIEELKKKWVEEYEESTAQKIQEAEENLKRRIRKPTEERINKLIEKKKTELEEEYKKKLLSEENGMPLTDQQRISLRKQLEKEMQDKFENDLKVAKKRAFEEGKQQASMKTTLLERKISKLENQLKERGEETAVETKEKPEKDSGHPILSKIDENSAIEKKAVQPPTSGEQVLKLDATPTFSFHTSANNNPFTSSFQAPGHENNSVFGSKPSFGSANNGSSSPFGKFATSFGNSTQKPTFSLTAKPDTGTQETDTGNQKTDADDIDSDKLSSAESQPKSGSSSPLKRPAENEKLDSAIENKRPKEEASN